MKKFLIAEKDKIFISNDTKVENYVFLLLDRPIVAKKELQRLFGELRFTLPLKNKLIVTHVVAL